MATTFDREWAFCLAQDLYSLSHIIPCAWLENAVWCSESLVLRPKALAGFIVLYGAWQKGAIGFSGPQ